MNDYWDMQMNNHRYKETLKDECLKQILSKLCQCQLSTKFIICLFLTFLSVSFCIWGPLDSMNCQDVFNFLNIRHTSSSNFGEDQLFIKLDFKGSRWSQHAINISHDQHDHDERNSLVLSKTVIDCWRRHSKFIKDLLSEEQEGVQSVLDNSQQLGKESFCGSKWVLRSGNIKASVFATEIIFELLKITFVGSRGTIAHMKSIHCSLEWIFSGRVCVSGIWRLSFEVFFLFLCWFWDDIFSFWRLLGSFMSCSFRSLGGVKDTRSKVKC